MKAIRWAVMPACAEFPLAALRAFFDLAAVHIITTSALRALKEARGAVLTRLPRCSARPPRNAPPGCIRREGLQCRHSKFMSLTSTADRIKMAVSTLSFARVGPVHFQPLEWELAPLASYFRGEVLNAGCGFRDISLLLKSFGATAVTNVDIETNLPGATVSPLDALPFENARFGSILCNAVLEHVGSAEDVMSELIRVLQPGGHLIVSIPFLQPYHESPTDYRRYTREGIKQLGERYGLEVIAIKPVHTIAQTIGWILWEYPKEHKGWALRMLLWPLIWLGTRVSCRSNLVLENSANTFQAVYRKLEQRE